MLQPGPEGGADEQIIDFSERVASRPQHLPLYHPTALALAKQDIQGLYESVWNLRSWRAWPE
eukprot:4750868-Pyramimonas_sp.AAC.1